MTAAPLASTGPPEDRREELPRLRLREPVDLHAADEAHPIHVGEQVHGLGHERELLGPDREHQEDRARGVRADDVAEQAEAVVVGPLEVVDQDGERSLGGEGAERDGAEIERAQEPAVGRQGREARVVLAGHRVEAPRERLGGVGLRASAPDRLGRSQDRAREQERAAELLVGGDRDRREPGRRGHLAGGEQQAGLPDAGLALERRAPASRPVVAEASSWRIASCSAWRPTTGPAARWTCSAIGENGLEQRRERRRAHRIGG